MLLLRPLDMLLHFVTGEGEFFSDLPVTLCVTKVYCFGLFVNNILYDTLPAPGKAWPFGADPKSCLQLWQTSTHGQRERFALGVNSNEKGGCVASLTQSGLAVLLHLLPEDKIGKLRKASALMRAPLETNLLWAYLATGEKRCRVFRGCFAATKAPQYMSSSKI